MAGKLFNIYSGNTGGALSTSTAKVGSFGTTSDNFYSVNFDTGRKSIWTNNIEFGRAADWKNISDIPSWIESNGVTWANVKDKPSYATRWPSWNEVTSKPAATGSATQPVYWDGSTFKVVNSVAPANHDHDKRYVKLDGSNVMSGDLTLNLGDLDRFIVFSYSNAVNPTSNSWRTGVLGTGQGENNFFVVQYQKVNTNSSDWNTVFKIGQDTGTVTFTNNIKVGSNTVYHSGNLPAYPKVNNGALNLQASGTTKVTFYANQSETFNFNIATGSTNGTISVGGTDVAVKGLGSNAYSSTAYLPLAGGTMDDNAQIKRNGKSGAWIHGRENALIRETSSTGYHPLFSLKTADGSWELGEYNTPGLYNVPIFSYITDENYNNGNNSATYQIKFPLASGTIALTADLTWSKIADKPSYATRWPSWNEVTSKPAATGSATQPVYWDGSTFKVVNSVAPANHNHDDRYLKLTGGTLSGDLAFSHGSSTTDQHITWASGTNYQRLKVRDGQTDVFIFQYSTDSGTTWSDYFTIQNGIAKIGSNTVYHSGNLPAYPKVNNGALNLQASGTTKVTFYANQSETSNFNIATGSANGTISVGGTDVAVKGLGSNAYNSTAYLPLGGGKMTGNISWKNSTALPEQSEPQYFLVIDAFDAGGATRWTSKANTLKALTGLTSTAKGTTSKPIYWDGTKFVECLAYSQANVNYANSAGSVDWGNVKNKPSTFAPSAHDHTRILYIDDRDTIETPTDVVGKNGIEIHFKNKSKSGITSDGTWTAVIMLDGYSDVSGGYPMELGFSMSDLSDSRPLYLRTPKSSTEWGDWRTILDSKTYTDFTVKKDGTGATGSWNINAATATKLQTARTITINGSSKSFDGSGNISWSLADLNLPSNDHNHDKRYVKLDGSNVMSGDLTLHLGDLDRFIVFSYSNAVNPTSNSWRTGVLGTGQGENNFFVVQYQKVNTNSSDWNTVFKIGQDTGTVTFTNNIKVGSYTVYHSGNLTAATLLGSTAKGTSSKPIYWDGAKFVECLAYSQANVNYANSAGNADTVDNKHASDFVYTAEVSAEQNSDVNTWAQNNADTNKRSLIYNISGAEWSYLSSLRNDGLYGAVIKFGYGNGHPAAFLKGKAGGSWYSGWVQFITSDNIGSQSVNHATSAGNAATADSAGNADKLDNFHAVDLFQTFTNDATNNAVKIKIGNTEKSLVVGYATKAGSANSATEAAKLNGVTSQNVNECAEDLKLRFYYNLNYNNGYCGSNNSYGFPCSNNANAILWLPTHPSNYGGQLGISSNGSLYYRFILGGSFSTAANGGSWDRILTSGNSSVSKSGETLSVKINGTTQSLTNTWRGITDSYNVDSPSSSTSLSQKGAKALYNALINGYANSAGNADTVDNYHLASWIYPTSPRDFADGTRIDTDIVYKNTNGDAFYMEIIGDTYFSLGSIYTIVQGYIYNDTIISYSVNNLGRVRLEHLYAMLIGDNLVFWFERLGYWQSYRIGVYKSSNGNYWENHCTSITNSAKPTGTKEIDLCVTVSGTVHTFNNAFLDSKVSGAESADSVPWSGITGKAVSKTAWGQTFVDASGNIQSISGNMTSVGQVTPDGNATRDNGTASYNWASVYTRSIISGDHLTLRSGTSKDIIFQTNAGTEYMRLTSSGKLGINSTDPGATVEIAGKSNTLLGINTSTYLIGHTRKDLHFTLNNGSGSGINDGYMSAITFGDGKTSSYAGIYVQSSGAYGTRIIFGTTDSYANGTYARVIIDATGQVGIGTMSPSEKLDVGGSIRAFNGTTNWVKMRPESTTWASFYTNSSKYYFDHRVEVNGDIWVYGTNYGITSSGVFYSKGFYHRDYMDNNYVLLSNGGAKKWDTVATPNTIVARQENGYIYAVYYNSAISNQDDMSPTSVYCSNDNWIRKQSISKFADNLRADEIITITKDLTVTEAWMDTGIIMNTTTFPHGTGTYAIQIASNTAGTDGWYPYFSGILTIYTSTTNGTLPDEVPLHCIGHSNNGDARRIYIRTIEGDGNTNGKIQIAGATTLSAHTYTFKFRKLI